MQKTISSRMLIFLAATAVLSTTGFVIASRLLFRVGFPLDDAWIYQTYARNLSQLGEWSFLPGEASGGSTGPLWVVFIALGYGLRINHLLWAFILGSAALFGLGVVGIWGFTLLKPDLPKWSFAAGLLLALEWHLVWASASGMETLLFALVVTFVLVYLFKPTLTWKDWLLTGFLIGASVAIRPDGVTLLGPAIFAALLGQKTPISSKIHPILLILLGFAVPFSLYLMFNQITSGTIWPNTFYAKQAEYASLQNNPYLSRLGQQVLLPLVGVGITLLPGFLFSIYQGVRERNWALLGCILWFAGDLGIYAARLPVTYQHGRYLIPAMPIYFLLGMAGMADWISRHTRDRRLIPRVFAKTWGIACFSVLGLFWVMGANSYAWDVAFIESEMVTTAQWIHTNTEPQALVAAHDIGALGYFSDRKIVDLAGLISPDVIPVIQDEAKLKNFLDLKRVTYLMTFPEWYPILTSDSLLIYKTQGLYSPQLGGENMAVYHWPQTNPGQ